MHFPYVGKWIFFGIYWNKMRQNCKHRCNHSILTQKYLMERINDSSKNRPHSLSKCYRLKIIKYKLVNCDIFVIYPMIILLWFFAKSDCFVCIDCCCCGRSITPGVLCSAICSTVCRPDLCCPNLCRPALRGATLTGQILPSSTSPSQHWACDPRCCRQPRCLLDI